MENNNFGSPPQQNKPPLGQQGGGVGVPPQETPNVSQQPAVPTIQPEVPVPQQPVSAPQGIGVSASAQPAPPSFQQPQQPTTMASVQPLVSVVRQPEVPVFQPQPIAPFPTQQFPTLQTPVEEKQSPAEGKKLNILAFIIVFLFLTALGVFGYWYYQEKMAVRLEFTLASSTIFTLTSLLGG